MTVPQPQTGVVPVDQMGLAYPLNDNAPMSPAVRDYIENVLGYASGTYSVSRAGEPNAYWSADPTLNSGMTGAGQGGWKVTGPNGETLLRQDMTGGASTAGWKDGRYYGSGGAPDGSSSGGGGGTVSVAGHGGTQAQRDAYNLIRQNLVTYGLPDTLADWAWNEIVSGKGNAEIMLDLQQRPEYKQTFPEIEARQKAGLAPLSPGDIVNYRQQARQMMQAAGLPSGFYDSPQDFTKFLMNDTSLSELSNRITDAAQAAYSAPPEYRQQWEQLGFGHGDLTAMMLNPDVAEPLLHKQWTAAQLAGTGVRTGYGQLSGDQALGLTELGVTVPQAEQGFGNLAHQQELFNPLNSGETAINQNDQLAAQFGGNAQAQQRIQDRARSRVAAFSGGGGFAGTTTGYSGLGNSGQ